MNWLDSLQEGDLVHRGFAFNHLFSFHATYLCTGGESSFAARENVSIHRIRHAISHFCTQKRRLCGAFDDWIQSVSDGSELQKALIVGVAGGFGAIGSACLGENAADVTLDRVEADHQLLGNLRVALAGDDQA